MPKKGNGVDLTNDYLRQILEKLGEVLVSQEGMRGEQEAMRREQEAMRREQEAMRVQIGNIEGAVRQIAGFIGQDRVRQDGEIEGLKRRVDALEQKAA